MRRKHTATAVAQEVANDWNRVTNGYYASASGNRITIEGDPRIVQVWIEKLAKSGDL